jgi:hypothetical protein
MLVYFCFFAGDFLGLLKDYLKPNKSEFNKERYEEYTYYFMKMKKEE